MSIEALLVPLWHSSVCASGGVSTRVGEACLVLPWVEEALLRLLSINPY